MNTAVLVFALCVANAVGQTPVQLQVKRTEVPLGPLLTAALAKTDLTSPGSKPFHIRIEVSDTANSQSPYQGTIEEWWASPQDWRRELVSKDGTRQTVVYSAGNKSEEDAGSYLPNWLRHFVDVAFDPVPDAALWTQRTSW